jgi:hypothetical protein
MMAAGADGRSGRKVRTMKIKSPLAGAVLVLALAGGGVAVAAVANADASTPAAPTGHTATTDAPGIGLLGQTGDKPPAGVTVTKAEPAVGIGVVGQIGGDKPPAGVTVTKGEAGTPGK